jgi:peptide-methionine (S)-S-oxide reductase
VHLQGIGLRRAGTWWMMAACVLIPPAILVAESMARDSLRPVVVSPAERYRSNQSVALFAGGCFWSMERPFDHVPGVVSTVVGYEGGDLQNPTYEQVSTGSTGNAETVQVNFDSTKVSYAQLLSVYWRNIDPFTNKAQFCDHGDEYPTAIFYLNDAQKDAATKSRAVISAAMTNLGNVVTEIVPAKKFWPAEAYHQHFADHNVMRYMVYRLGCGRDQRLQQIWGDSAEPYVPAVTNIKPPAKGDDDAY